ncbi:hypothetical protein SSS_08872 [Sarcoptes scabiei]|uniref:DRBM domain-containing protein n=1 Tax=Sarcoptes scabiei TaxID=52283 RepID=A0A131ZT94_SARSC|nr:hypothetical protein SSS_08872 [Sarcoptes scabiei]KPL99225.1 hypothetical protein QR98_0004060 [Sarcoptes scabiei]
MEKLNQLQSLARKRIRTFTEKLNNRITAFIDDDDDEDESVPDINATDPANGTNSSHNLLMKRFHRAPDDLVQYCETKQLPTPIFELNNESKSGPRTIFEITIKIGNRKFYGNDISKRLARCRASLLALDYLQGIETIKRSSLSEYGNENGEAFVTDNDELNREMLENDSCKSDETMDAENNKDNSQNQSEFNDCQEVQETEKMEKQTFNTKKHVIINETVSIVS